MSNEHPRDDREQSTSCASFHPRRTGRTSTRWRVVRGLPATRDSRLTVHRTLPDTSCVLRRSVFAAIATTTLVALVGFTTEARPLLPGDRMGTMLFVRTVDSALASIVSNPLATGAADC